MGHGIVTQVYWLTMTKRESHRAGVYHLSDDERVAVRKGMDAARRGEFASDEEMRPSVTVIANERLFHAVGAS